jgi:4-amino-4-deoxy-L-arabinose transferase-like glycosyltransferase
LVFCWCGAMCAGWRGLQPDGRTRDWIVMGGCLGLALLSKYTALVFVPSLALFLVLRPEARVHLRRPGPWLALLVVALAACPIVIWNAQHGWVTLQHVSENAKLDKPWQPTLRYFLEFTVGEAGLLHAVFFVAMLVAVFRFWPAARAKPLQLYLFAMGGPVFFGYWLYTFHSRVQLNWIAPAVVPLLGLTLLYWEDRRRDGARWVTGWLAGGLAVGAAVVVFLHDTDLIRRVARVSLPASLDPLRRVRAIRDLAVAVGNARRELEQAEGKEAFIIAAHYGLTGQITFYLPEARVGLPGRPLVYVRTTRVPRNQFYFWPEYRYGNTRRGQNAIYVAQNDKPSPPPPELAAEFDAITDLGMRSIRYGNREFHLIQLYACRNLR